MTRFKYGGDNLRVRVTSARCVYCGSTATTDEHFPPRCCTDRGFILNACQECNILASNNFPYDFYLRAELVKKKIKKKYRKALQTPDWCQDELSKLGYAMQESVKKWQMQKRITQERLAWSAAIYLSSIDHKNVFAPIDADANFTMLSEKELMKSLEKIAE